MERNRGIVSVVGSALSDGGTAMARAIAAIGDIRVYMLSLSSSGINLTVVVDGAQVHPAMQRLHEEFFAGGGPLMSRLAIIGLGRMGRALAALAPERGWRVVARRSILRRKAMPASPANRSAMRRWPSSSPYTERCAAGTSAPAMAAGCPIVVGSTGWDAQRDAIETLVKRAGGALLTAPNFSIGVAIFHQVVREAARLFAATGGFESHLIETHHSAKKDAPSGTAASLAKAANESSGGNVGVTSIRVGSVPGTHELVFDAPFEQVRLVHEARDRRVFAEGALLAARWLVGRTGVFTMQDVLRSNDAGGN